MTEKNPLSHLAALDASSPEGGAFRHLPVSRAKPPPFGGGGFAKQRRRGFSPLNSPSHLALLDASPLWDGAFGMAVQFPAQAQSVRACSLPLGGAVAQRLRGFKWRSEKSVKAIAPTGAALAFLCFDFFFRIVKGEQPLARCGVGGVQR